MSQSLATTPRFLIRLVLLTMTAWFGWQLVNARQPVTSPYEIGPACQATGTRPTQ